MQSEEGALFEHQLQPAPRIARTATPVASEDRQNKTRNGDRVVVWTDGACARNHFRSLCRVGCGVFFGSGHPSNMSFALPGPEQSNQRAESVACLSVMECEPRHMEIRTDSKYVVDGASCSERKGYNFDLWRSVHEKLAARGEGNTIIVKVKRPCTKLTCDLRSCACHRQVWK